MNKLLAISIALLSVSLYGADKLNLSYKGLEGWGKEGGINIVIEDYSNIDKTFDEKAISNIVELKLRLAGIKVTDKLSFDGIYINLNQIVAAKKIVGYAVNIRPQRTIFFRYNGKEYTKYNSTTDNYGGISSRNYRPSIESLMDKLLLDYLKANPKKEKE